MEAYYSRQSRFTVDTLVSSSTGRKIPVDSFVSENYSLRHHSPHLRIDLSAIWRSSQRRKTSLYAGAGVSAGISVSSTTTITYNKNSSTVNYFPGQYYSRNTHYSASEINLQKPQRSYIVYCPFGIDYRFSKKDETLRKLSTFMEFRAQLTYTSIPELHTSPGGSMHFIWGIRWSGA